MASRLILSVPVSPNEELTAPEKSDAVVFLGPPTRFDNRVPEGLVEPRNSDSPRFFYFELKVFRERGGELPDLIEHLIKRVGGKTIRIHTAGEFAKALDVLQGHLSQGSP